MSEDIKCRYRIREGVLIKALSFYFQYTGDEKSCYYYMCINMSERGF